MFSKRRDRIVIGGLIAVVVILVVVIPTVIIVPLNNNNTDNSSSSSASEVIVTETEPTTGMPTQVLTSIPTLSTSRPTTTAPILNGAITSTPQTNGPIASPLSSTPQTDGPTTSPTSAPQTNGPTAPSPIGTPQTNGPTMSSPIGTPPSNGPRNFLFLAFYYPWYIRNNWNQHGTQGSTPLLGLYGTDEIGIAEQHIDWAVNRGGIDAWVVSWWENDIYISEHFARGMLSASNIDQIKFCMNYESKGALPTPDFGDGRALNKIINDMRVFRDTYFGHPSYLKVNGRPVVYLYITRTWVNFQPSMLDIIKNEVGVDILFIADEPYHGEQRFVDTARYGVRDGKPIFEAYTTYNMFEDVLVRDGETATDFMFREGLPIFDRWSRETVFFPNVLPKYHDFRGHQQLVGDTEGLRQQLATFACLPRPSWYNNEFPDMMFVTTFNEWWEGSQVEPDAQDEYGFSFLDTIKAFKESEVQCGHH